MGDPTKPRRSRKHRGAQQQQARTQTQGPTLRMDPRDLEQARAGLGSIEAQRAALMASTAAVGTEDGVDFDFDIHWAGKSEAAKPRTVRIKGQLYTLPGSMPAAVMAIGMRKEFRDPNREISVTEAMQLTMDMLAGAVGEDSVKQMMRDGITMEEFPDILAYIMGTFDEVGRAREVVGEPTPGEAGGGPAPANSGT